MGTTDCGLCVMCRASDHDKYRAQLSELADVIHPDGPIALMAVIPLAIEILRSLIVARTPLPDSDFPCLGDTATD